MTKNFIIYEFCKESYFAKRNKVKRNKTAQRQDYLEIEIKEMVNVK